MVFKLLVTHESERDGMSHVVTSLDLVHVACHEHFPFFSFRTVRYAFVVNVTRE